MADNTRPDPLGSSVESPSYRRNIDLPEYDDDKALDKKYREAGSGKMLMLLIVIVVWNLVCFGLKVAGVLTDVQAFIGTIPPLAFALIYWAAAKRKLNGR